MQTVFVVVCAVCVAAASAWPMVREREQLLRSLHVHGQSGPRLQWGTEGHQLVAAAASQLLSATTLAKVQAMLGSGVTMASVAGWADMMRDTWRWSAPLHYIDIADGQCSYVRSRDCGTNFCVDGAIQNYTARVAHTQLASTERLYALKFLIHFVGDVHQPLHVGWTSDAGGNTEVGTYLSYKSKTLHSLWDTYLLDTRVNSDFGGSWDSWASALVSEITTGIFQSKAHAWATCSPQSTAPYHACSDEWATESISAACQYAYVAADGTTPIKNGFSLGMPYYTRVQPVFEAQLAKAAVRLATVLTAIFA